MAFVRSSYLNNMWQNINSHSVLALVERIRIVNSTHYVYESHKVLHSNRFLMSCDVTRDSVDAELVLRDFVCIRCRQWINFLSISLSICIHKLQRTKLQSQIKVLAYWIFNGESVRHSNLLAEQINPMQNSDNMDGKCFQFLYTYTKGCFCYAKKNIE